MVDFTRYVIPNECIFSEDLRALENYMDSCESYLSMIAMESTGSSNDQFTDMSTRARAAGRKMIDGKKEDNAQKIQEGTRELSQITNELTSENQKESPASVKMKILSVAKILVAVIGSVFIAFGVYKAGKAIRSFFGNKDGKSVPSQAESAKLMNEVQNVNAEISQKGDENG